MLIDLAPLYAKAAKLKALIIDHLNGDHARQAPGPDEINAMLTKDASLQLQVDQRYRGKITKMYAKESEAMLKCTADGFNLEDAIVLSGLPWGAYMCMRRGQEFTERMYAARREGEEKRRRRRDPAGWYLDGELRRAREVRAAA